VEGLFVVFQVVFEDRPGLSIFFLSLVVNSALLPIYSVADRWLQEDRNLLERMRRKIADIKAVFKGDERQMILNTYHRQMGYTPLGSLKARVGILLQIPFFLGVYEFLSHTTSLRGKSFLFIPDLGAPDGWGRLFGFSINLMPILMTAINILSSLVYTKKAEAKERVQLFAMAAVFLILLYRSPSGLVLYWTINNVFSLGRNLAVSRLRRPVLVLRWTVSVAALGTAIALLSGVSSMKLAHRHLMMVLCLTLVAVPFIWSRLVHAAEGWRAITAEDRLLFFTSGIVLWLLTGFLAPIMALSSSPTEYDRPWQFMIRTLLQGFSAFVMVPGFIWAFSGNRGKRVLSAMGVSMAVLSLISFFVLSGSHGTLTRGFAFDNPHRIKTAFPLWANAAAALGTFGSVALFHILKRKKALAGLLGGVAVALVLTSVVEAARIRKALTLEGAAGETVLGEVAASGGAAAPAGNGADGGVGVAGAAGSGGAAGFSGSAEHAGKTHEVFHLSRKGNNTFILFLDRAVGVAFYHALDLLPDTIAEMEGFVWYPRTVSFGDCTILGVPSMLGGYDYSPGNVNARSGMPLVEKINESLTLLPRLFGEAGRRVSITDPSLAGLRWIPDTSIFDGIPHVNARNIKGLYSKRFFEENGYPPQRVTESFDYDIMFRFAVFRASLPAFRYYIYYNGGWWRDGRSNSFERSLAVFPNLYYLSDLCAVDDGGPTLNIFMNESTHEHGAFTPDLMPSREPVTYDPAAVARFGTQGDAGYAHAFLAAIRAVGVWLRHLKERGVYDNTKIIVVADHGGNFRNDRFEIPGMERFNPLLLVKERGVRGSLRIEDSFMVNADVPALVLSGDDGVSGMNPHTGRPIDRSAAGEEPLRVYEAPGSQNRHGPYGFTLLGSRAYRGGDIYMKNSWGDWEEQ